MKRREAIVRVQMIIQHLKDTGGKHNGTVAWDIDFAIRDLEAELEQAEAENARLIDSYMARQIEQHNARRGKNAA